MLLGIVIVVLQHLWVVKGSLVVIKRVKLTDNCGARGLSVECDLARRRTGLLTSENVRVILVAVLNAIDNQRRVHRSLHLFVDHNAVSARERLLRLNLA